MKQLVLDYKSGDVQLVDTPAPAVRPGALLVHNRCSTVSVGTEALMMDLARKSLLGKARARPDLVRQVIAKARNEGLVEAYRAAMGRLETPVPLGYSCAGYVAAVGQDVRGYQMGDAAACFGSGYASHAQVVSVSENLCVHVPEGVGFEAAAFVGPGAIALHALHLGEVSLGSRIVVLGLGLLGQLAVQMIVAAGGRIFGVDLDPWKNTLAVEQGAEAAETPGPSAVEQIKTWSGGMGADGVLVFASSKYRSPVELAAEVARERAWVVVPGMVDLGLPRRLFYEKELRLVVSRSAGPGIYDPQYEQKGQDYPLSYVRWTAQRNMQEFLELVAHGKVRVEPIITHRFPMEQALDAYQVVSSDTVRRMGVLLTYPETSTSTPSRVQVIPQVERKRQGRQVVRIGLIGAGTFAKTTLLPLLKNMDHVSLQGVATASGLTARHAADKFGFAYCTSDYRELLTDPEVDAVIIATRHHLHASQAAEALAAGKDVLVEKPLATTPQGLAQVGEVHAKSQARLMVGFNRRFSPFAVRTRQTMERRMEPAVIHCRVNAGPVPPHSWVLDPTEGGGRVIGEVCHFVDLIHFLAGSRVVRVHAAGTRGHNGSTPDENLVVNLELEDGSVASITYVSMGHRAFPRERVECFWDSSVCLIDNFKSALIIDHGRRSRMPRWNVDRGHRAELETFVRMVRTGAPPPVSLAEYVHTTLVTFAIVESLKTRAPVEVDARALWVVP